MKYRIRYRPGTDLARRFPDHPRGPWSEHDTREAAEAVVAACVNGEQMEVLAIEVEE